jgi:hypothetical protein
MDNPEPTDWWSTWLRAWGLRAPLSGDVSQDIQTSLIRSAGDQLGFININTARAGDPGLEHRIVTEVASYGRQLGRLLDAVAVLARQAESSVVSADDRRALDELEALHEEVEAAKASFAGGRVERLVDEIRNLRRDPAANAEALQRLRDALADD